MKALLMVSSNLLTNLRAGLEKFRSYNKIYGFKRTISELARNILLVEVFHRLEKDLMIPEERHTCKLPVKICQLIGESSLDAWHYRNDVLSIRGEYGLKQFAERLRNGDVLFYAALENEMVGFNWVGREPWLSPGYKLNNDEYYNYDGWTFEAYRGNDVFPVILQAGFVYARNNWPGIRRAVAHVAVWNKASIAGSRRAGFIMTQNELGVVILGLHRKFKLNSFHVGSV